MKMAGEVVSDYHPSLKKLNRAYMLISAISSILVQKTRRRVLAILTAGAAHRRAHRGILRLEGA